MGVIELISNAFGAIKEFFGFQSKRLEEKNTQEMKNAGNAQKEQNKKDDINKAIEEKNVQKIREGLS